MYHLWHCHKTLAKQSNVLYDHQQPNEHLVQASLSGGETAGLPFALASFDLITCTNTWHYPKDPAARLEGLGLLLVSAGQVAIEDYVLCGFLFLGKPLSG